MRAIASTLIHAVVLCGSAQRYRALMVFLQSHRTQNMILRCYPNVAICYTSETYQILSPVLFQQSLYFPLLIYRIFLFTCLCSFFTCFAVLEESRSFAPPKKWLISMVTWGIKCARGRRRRRIMQLHNFCHVYTYTGP